MNWIHSEHGREARGGIETYQQFRKRNLDWWKANRLGESRTRAPYYEQFLEKWMVRPYIEKAHCLGEIGPGPFGGMIEVLKLAVSNKVFIDYLLEDLVGLNFISWPKDAVYVNASAESIPLADNSIDLLLSYNCLDHGWNIWAALIECIRVSRYCFLSFDCRGDDPHEVEIRKKMKDLDHYQLLHLEDVENFVEEYAGRMGYFGGVFRWDIGKTFPVSVVIINKEEQLCSGLT